MAYTLWRYTIFLFIWFRTTESKEAIYCKGTNWKAGYVDSTVAANRSIIMRNTFTGCTHVIGNVEITYQQDTSIDFSFMNDIEDVSGYVLVTQSYIPYIPLPKLTVIRGEELFKESTALYVSYNYNQTSSDAAIAERTVGLLELRLVSLKEITKGGVLIFENSELCHAPSIDWTDIVVDTSTDIEVTYPLIQCDDCDSNCTEGCWGSGPEMCQILTKNVCNSSCENRCFGPGADQCCDANCIGGCTGSGPDQCLLCRNALNGDSCVETCPGKLVLDEGKCKEQCRPEWANINGVCEKSISCLGVDFTTKNTVVSGDNIATYKNCRVVKHNVIIDRESFHGDPFFGTIPLMSYGELFALENVEIIKGYLKIFGVDQSGVINLKFLRNLKEVHGDELEGEESIIISGSKSLKTLSLSSLKSVKRGDVQITNNVNLCLAKEDKWTAILLDYQTQKISISSNELRVNCEAQGYKCDKECYRYGGCWDVGADNCYECESFKLEGEEGSRCVNSCNTSRGEYHSSNKTCGLCDKQCDGTCTGPSSSECLSCRNFKDGDKCKEECPEYKYPDADKVCRPCHKDCVLGCTGESHIKGEGGCDDCYVTKIDHDQNKREIRECLPRTASCSEHFYEIKAIAEARICRECNSICLNCSGPSSDDCVSCITTSVDGKCVEKCDSNQGAFNGKCIQCHEQCSSGCTGPTAKDCKACAKAQVDFNGGIFECVRSCPKDLAIGVCVDGSDDNVVGIVVGLVCAVLSIIVMLILIFYCYFRRKKESKEYYDLPAAVEVPLHDAKFNRVTARASGRAPNKAKLTIIKQTEIIKGAELGAGAFGTVYSGFWVPDNKRFRIPVAIKVLQDMSPSSSDELLAESGVMATVEHRCVLRLLAVCMSEPMMMITQLMPLGALLDYVRKNHNQIGAYHLLNWSMQISEGMEYLESKHLIHRDLAARNVLVQSPNQVKITDFGLAKFLEVDQQKFLAEGGKVAVKWLAPECLKYALFTHESDVWSFGVTIWELMTFGSKPYEGHRARDILDLIGKGERLKQPTICTIDVYMLLLKCWVIDPTARPKFSLLVEEFGKMAQDPQRFVVIENDDEKQLPTFDKEEFYSDFFDDDDAVCQNGILSSNALVEAEDYLTPMDLSTEIDGIPPGEAEYINEEPVNHYQDLIKEKMEESEDELESGLRTSVGVNGDAPTIPANSSNLGDYMGLSEVTGDSMAIGPHIDNPEYHSLNTLDSSPQLKSKNPWDRKPTGPKDNKKGKKGAAKNDDTCGDNGISSDAPLQGIRPRAVSNVYVDDQMQVMSRPEEQNPLVNGGRFESSV